MQDFLIIEQEQAVSNNSSNSPRVPSNLISTEIKLDGSTLPMNSYRASNSEFWEFPFTSSYPPWDKRVHNGPCTNLRFEVSFKFSKNKNYLIFILFTLHK